MFDPFKKTHNPDTYWNIADKWFRILEMALILGGLGYLKVKTENLLLAGLYWVSFAVLFWWFLEQGEKIAKDYSDNSSLHKKWIVYCVALTITLFFYFAITGTTQWIIKQQVY